MIAYFEPTTPLFESSPFLVVSDLVAHREPEFVRVDRGDVVLAVRGNGHAPRSRVWLVEAVYRVRHSQETSDAFEFGLDLVARFDARGVSIHRDEVLAACNWIPNPSRFFKPVPTSVWAWLEHVHGFDVAVDETRRPTLVRTASV
jgi:hypothetical protein